MSSQAPRARPQPAQDAGPPAAAKAVSAEAGAGAPAGGGAAKPPGPPRDHYRPPLAPTTILAVAAGLLAAVAFGLVLVLVVRAWSPLRALDVAAVDRVNALVAPDDDVVGVLSALTGLGGARTAVVLLSLTIAWLLLRRRFRLGAYVAVTGIGLAVLDPAVKALVERPRPLPDFAVAVAPGPSFPSGHAMTSLVTYGVLLLVFLPAIAPRWRRPVIALAAAIVVVVGVTRVALGVHYPSDVVGGWLLGSVWLMVTTAALRLERADHGVHGGRLRDGVAPEDAPSLRPPPSDHPLPAGWRSASRLLVAAVLMWGGLVGIGLAITRSLPAVRRLDREAVEWLVGLRSEDLTALLRLVGHLGDTVVIVIVAALASVVALATTRRWAPTLLVVLAAGGQAVLYWASSRVVDRPRPSLERLAIADLPAQAAFPSGHVAAVVATYGAIALLVIAWTTPRLRYAAVAFVLVAALLVAVSRVYLAVHHPTDVVASGLYASAWLAVCWHVLRPARGAPPDTARRAGAVDEIGSARAVSHRSALAGRRRG